MGVTYSKITEAFEKLPSGTETSRNKLASRLGVTDQKGKALVSSVLSSMVSRGKAEKYPGEKEMIYVKKDHISGETETRRKTKNGGKRDTVDDLTETISSLIGLYDKAFSAIFPELIKLQGMGHKLDRFLDRMSLLKRDLTEEQRKRKRMKKELAEMRNRLAASVRRLKAKK